MKHIWYGLTLALSLSGHAAEVSDNETHCSSAHAYPKIVRSIYCMDAEQLGEFAQPLTRSFTTLKEEGMMDSFTSDQVLAIDHYFKKTNENIPDVGWDVSVLNMKEEVSLRDFFHMYLDLQAIRKPQGKMSFSSLSDPDSDDILTYLKAVYPYSEIPNKSSSTTSTPNFVELSKDSKKISKISRHFEGIQKSILSTPRGEIWQWIEMRYHVEKLHHHLRERSSMENLPSQKNGQTFTNLLPKTRLEINEFIQDVKGLTLSMQNVIDLPIQPGQSGSFRATPCYGHILKVFFDQFPKLNILKDLDEAQGKNHKVMDFWKLYLELHKNYSNKSRQTKYNFDTAKLSHLCNELLAPQRNYDKGDVEGALTQFPGVNTHLKGILGVFSNPFDPKLNEILQFDFYLDNISHALETHRKNVTSQTSLPSSQNNGFFSSWW